MPVSLTDTQATEVVHRCERALAGITERSESSVLRGWRAAIEAARDGDGVRAAAALGVLPEHPRFAATIVLGLVFPAVLVATAESLDESLTVKPEALDWFDCCEMVTMMRWAESATDLDASVLAAVCARSHGRSAGLALLAGMRDRLNRDDVPAAALLHSYIPEYAKQEKATAAALLVIRGHLTADDAIRDAKGFGVIQDGREEAEALSSALAEYVRAGLRPDDDSVLTTIAAMKLWGDDRVPRDVRSYGLAFGAQACVRAGWLDHARSLAEILWDFNNKEPVLAAIESGVGQPERIRALHQVPTIDDIIIERTDERRLEAATARALGRFDDHDSEGALESLTVALDSGYAAADVVTPADRTNWARSLAAGGDQDTAVRILDSLMAAGELGPGAYSIPLEDLDIEHQRAFVVAALMHGLATERTESGQSAPPAAIELADIVEQIGDPELETGLLRATAALGSHEDASLPSLARAAAGPVFRTTRIVETLRILDALHRDDDDEASVRRFREWGSVFDDAERPLLAAAAVAYIADLGSQQPQSVRPECLGPVAAELARRGRLDDALALIRGVGPDDLGGQSPEKLHLSALLEVARASDSAEFKTVNRALNKCKSSWNAGGRDKADRALHKYYIGAIALACGDVDRALTAAAALPNVPYRGCGAADLAIDIAARMDAEPAQWTASRAAALIEALRGRGVRAENLVAALMRFGASTVEHYPELDSALTGLRFIFGNRDPGDAALVDAVAGLGLVRAGHTRQGIGRIAEAVDTAQGKRHHSASPFHFAEVVTELPAAMPERADLLRGACSLVRDSYNVEAAIGAAHRIIGLADADDLPLIAETLTDLALSQEYTQSVQNRIGVASIRHGVDASLLPLESATEPAAVRRHVRLAARFLARRGFLPEAKRLGALAGLQT
ncbi:hypothetical protein GOPIP_092_00560 [Gordonia polyisoprenivorans NBRC 16320 = JCM 10675]|uniref:Uncharacterized protein n=1 Tax=Gordonia polyisoprenivorans TaxID=84595 RepID=A0A846WR57_9ACTN|nr:hypothetical protein [Gordonia polyisoprenivorans]NKY04035.1 hypothetical protein [Gordonia polyisoprenivorans]GAB26138.1 hypothetical protein GOPIP_092_00560 [Gordonia polyisoprenivorans NBRC 16320 = JCM 10675]